VTVELGIELRLVRESLVPGVTVQPPVHLLRNSVCEIGARAIVPSGAFSTVFCQDDRRGRRRGVRGDEGGRTQNGNEGNPRSHVANMVGDEGHPGENRNHAGPWHLLAIAAGLHQQPVLLIPKGIRAITRPC